MSVPSPAVCILPIAVQELNTFNLALKKQKRIKGIEPLACLTAVKGVTCKKCIAQRFALMLEKSKEFPLQTIMFNSAQLTQKPEFSASSHPTHCSKPTLYFPSFFHQTQRNNIDFNFLLL